MARRPDREVQYLPQVTVLTSADWKRIKGKAQRKEETSTEAQLEEQKSNEKRQRQELEAQCIANARDTLFCDSEAIRRFHSALMLTEVLKERETQIEMKRKIKKTDAEYLEKEELQRNRELAAKKEFQKYTEGVITSAAEAKLNLIPLIRAACAGIDTHGPVYGGIPVFYQPVSDEVTGERRKAEKHERSVVDVGISGLGFDKPEPLEYEYPDLSSKEIGRFTRLLLETDRRDKRINAPIVESELTKFVAKAWAKGQGKLSA